MPCLIDAKISLVPKHQLMVPSTLLALATNIRRYKATKIHTLTPLTYELFFKIVQKWQFWVAIGQTLALGSSLSNTLRTNLHAWNKSSIIVQSMVKFSWQHNLSIGFYGTFKISPGRLDFWCSKGKNAPTPRNSKTESQRSEPNWRLKYLIAPNFCAKFQPNRLTTTFGPWNTFSDNDSWRRSKCSQG